MAWLANDTAVQPRRRQRRARADAQRRRRWGVSAMSFGSPAMAATPLSHSCPIRIVSVCPGHLLDAACRLLRMLFLDREGQI
jgi:hypothetical protein